MPKPRKHRQALSPADELERKIAQHRCALSGDVFSNTLRSAIKRAQAILATVGNTSQDSMKWHSLCFGLGSLSENRVSRIQLVVLECLLELLGASKENCLMYDPQFNEIDRDYLRKVGYSVIEENEEGRHRVQFQSADEFLFAYLPHCGTVLYENFFTENWNSASQLHWCGGEAEVDCKCAASALTLNRTLFIGNQLTAIRDRSLERVWRNHYPHLAYLAEHIALDCELQYADEPHAHSDTSLQLLTIDPEDPEFSRLCGVKPVYNAEALDIVLKTDTHSSLPNENASGLR